MNLGKKQKEICVVIDKSIKPLKCQEEASLMCHGGQASLSVNWEQLNMSSYCYHVTNTKCCGEEKTPWNGILLCLDQVAGDTKTPFSPDTSSSSSEDPWTIPETELLPCVLGLLRGLPESPGGIWYPCPSHMSWLLSMWRKTGSTPSSSLVSYL